MNRNQLPHPISHSEINQSLYHLPSSGLIVVEYHMIKNKKLAVNLSMACDN
jgi:hypothetical protein